VLVVAVSALDQALIYTMPEWHIELGLLLQVTGVAKLGLRLDQKLFTCSCMVWRVAVDATDLILPVERIRAIEVGWPGSMAGEATLVDRLRGCIFQIEVKDELLRVGILRLVSIRFQFRFGMCFARAVTAFAIGAGSGFG